MLGRLLFVLPFFLLATPLFAQQTTTTTTGFDNWEMVCAQQPGSSENGVKICEIRSSLIVRDKDTNQQALGAIVAIGRSLNKRMETHFVVQVPVHALLNVPVKIVDKNDELIVEIPFVACQPGFCSANIQVSDIQLSALKRIGQHFYVSYRHQAGKDLKIEGSIKGFDKAIEAMMSQR